MGKVLIDLDDIYAKIAAGRRPPTEEAR